MCTRVFLLFCVLMAGCGKKDGGGSNVSEAVDAHGFTEEEATYYRTMGNLINSIRLSSTNAPGMLMEELGEGAQRAVASNYCNDDGNGFTCKNYIKSRVQEGVEYFGTAIIYVERPPENAPNAWGFVMAIATGAVLEEPQ